MMLTQLSTLISPRAFLQGLGGVLLIYTLLLTFILIKGPEKLEELQTQLATETVELPSFVKEQQSRSTDPPPPETRSSGSKNDVAQVPAEEIDEAHSKNHIPPVGADQNTHPFDAYKKQFVLPSNKPVISLIIQDYGLSGLLSETVLKELDPNITLILSPYADNIKSWQNKARTKGHELWIQLPLETQEFPAQDPGPLGIFFGPALGDNIENMETVLNQASEYAGIAVQSDSLLSDNKTSAEQLFDRIYKSGLGVFEINPNAPDFLKIASKKEDVPYFQNDSYVHQISLKALERKAIEKGYAVAVLSPAPRTLESLTLWIKTLEKKGIALAPLSALNDLEQLNHE